MNQKPIRTFPFIDFTISPSIGTRYDPIDWYRIIRFSTRLRKRDVDGRIYSWIHTYWYRIYELDYQDPVKLQDHIGDALSRFNSDIYLTMLFGKVTPGLTSHEGFLVFEPDADQTDEEDRMRKLFNIKP